MWARKEDKNETDSLLKETLLKQLSQAVKEVQLYYSQTGEECSTQEGTSSLVTVLEAIFLHALKRSLIETAIRTVGVTDDIKPKPSFYGALQTVTHKNTLVQIAELQRVKTDVGKSRAWIRMALNEAAVSSYMSAIGQDKRMSRFYRLNAFLRDKEALDTAANLVDGLIQVPFNIPYNTSILNIWSSEPLLMSGLWSPALRPSVQVAVDVAGTIEDEETCSLMTASSSMRSLIIIDDDQALKLILQAPTVNEEDESNVEPILQEAAGMQEMKEEKINEEELRKMQRSFSSLVASCSPQVADLQEDYGLDLKISIDEVRTSELQTEAMELPEANICKSVEIPDYSEMLKKEMAKEEQEGDLKVIDDFVVVKKIDEKKRKMEDVVLKIQRDYGLKMYNFECSDCKLSIGLNFSIALFCNITGEYLCELCHKGDLSVVPARIVFNWDFTKYPIGKRASLYLTKNFSEPEYDVETLNPQLYTVVPELRNIRKIRKKLHLLSVYLATCKENVKIPTREYLYQNVHKYSLYDLLRIPGGTLMNEIMKLIGQARNHVIGCWVCKQKGFICELCKDPQVIYPFDAGSVFRCSKCKAVYHGQCIAKDASCPKCKRRKQRQLQQQTSCEEPKAVLTDH